MKLAELRKRASGGMVPRQSPIPPIALLYGRTYPLQSQALTPLQSVHPSMVWMENAVDGRIFHFAIWDATKGTVIKSPAMPPVVTLMVAEHHSTALARMVKQYAFEITEQGGAWEASFNAVMTPPARVADSALIAFEMGKVIIPPITIIGVDPGAPDSDVTTLVELAKDADGKTLVKGVRYLEKRPGPGAHAHKEGCPMGRALGPAGVACEHGFDVCPICDQCTCEGT